MEAVKTYYKHHCPSWIGEKFVELAVQGTSSEFYPRRNYKIKTKTKYHDANNPNAKSKVHMFFHKGPYADDYKENVENTRQKKWYMNNYTNGITTWTMKVDFMESSGSYNAGFAGMMGTAYTKHPLQDYINSEAISIIDTRKTTNSFGQEVDEEYNLLAPDIKFTDVTDFASNTNIRWDDYRTSLLGFPVMAFHKFGDKKYRFIGYYRMLLDKGSDEVLGFSPDDKVEAKYLDNQSVANIAECWEFSNNNRTYCSYRDPYDRNVLSFAPKANADTTDLTNYTAHGIPIVADSFEYRYHTQEDCLDILYELGSYDTATKKWTFKGPTGKDQATSIATFKDATGLDLSSTETWSDARNLMLDWYKNWEVACQWVWSTCIDNVVGMGNYVIAPVGNVEFTTDGSLFIPYQETYKPITSGVFNAEQNYYKQETKTNAETGETTTTYVPVYVYGALFGGARFCRS